MGRMSEQGEVDAAIRRSSELGHKLALVATQTPEVEAIRKAEITRGERSHGRIAPGRPPLRPSGHHQVGRRM
jgi:hypothetical protein